MTTTDDPTHNAYDVAQRPAVGSGSLLRAEVHRFTARRFIRILVLVGVIGYLGIVAVMAFAVFARPSAADLARAEALRDQAIVEQNQGREQCLADQDQLPPGVSAEEACGPVATPETMGINSFIDKPGFRLAEGLPGGAVVVGSLTAALAFLIGATYVGAEWSTRSMVALLF